MAVQAAGQITLIDLTDARVAQLVLESSGAQVQVYDGLYSPDYSVNAVVVTPKLYLGNDLQEIERTKITYIIQGGEEIIYLTAINSSQNGFQLNDDCSLTISENIPISQDRYYIQATIQDFTDSITGLIQENITASIEFTLLQSSGTIIPKVTLEADSLISILLDDGEAFDPAEIKLLATIEGFDFNKVNAYWYKDDEFLVEEDLIEGQITYTKIITVSSETLPATYSFKICDLEGNELAKDQITLVILRNGQDGSAVNLLVSNEMTNVSCFTDTVDMGEGPQEIFVTRSRGLIESTIRLYQGTSQINLFEEEAKVIPSGEIFYHSIVSNSYLGFEITINQDGSISVIGEYPYEEDKTLVNMPFEAGALPIQIIIGENTYETAISWVPVTGGQDGQDSVYVKIFSSNGTILTEENSSTVLTPTVYRGGEIVESGYSVVWKDTNGKILSNTKSYTVNRNFVNIVTIFCEVTLSSNLKISDQITIMDKADSITSEIVCSHGDKFINGLIPGKKASLACYLYKGNNPYTPPKGTIYRWKKMEDNNNDSDLSDENEIIIIQETTESVYVFQEDELIENNKIIYECEVILPESAALIETTE